MGSFRTDHSQSDNTRASELELHIQRRVAAELSKISSQVDASIRSLSESVSSADPSSKSSSTASSNNGAPLGADENAIAHKDDDLSRESVQKEIDTLKEKLQKRKMREEVVGDKEVERAKDKVVQCLRVNDRRPLNCWREVEGFKREVGRLESRFLSDVVD